MRPLLLAAGYVNVDITAELPKVPSFGERTTAKRVWHSAGGMTANMACAAAQLGLEVHFFGRVGQDAAGKEAIEEFERCGVDTSGVEVTEGFTTTSLILVGPDGDRAIVSEPMTFHYGPLLQEIGQHESRSKCLHIDGYRLPEVLPVLLIAKERGFVVTADLDGIDPGQFPELLPEIASVLDVAFVNGAIAHGISANPETAVTHIVASGVPVVALTLGARGAIIADREGLRRVDPYSACVVDTTGAGDMFAAAFVAEWIEGGDADRAGTFAAAASALSVEAQGARGRLPNRNVVEKLVNTAQAKPSSSRKGGGLG